MNGEFQRVIEKLVRIVLGGAWGQEEHFELLSVPFQPSCDELSVMDFQVVQNEEYLLSGHTNQTTHELYEPLLIHGVLIEHKANEA